MQVVNVHSAKTNLSKLIEQVLSGEEVIIGKAGKPVVRMVKYHALHTKRTMGIWKGKVTMSPDFTKEDKTINELFYGKE